MKEIVINQILALELVLLIYLFWAAFYFLTFAIAARFYKEKQTKRTFKKQKVAILIPSYKEDCVIVDTTVSAMQHKSRKADIEVVVIADSLQNDTLSDLRSTGATVFHVEFDKSTKAKSINKALDKLDATTDYVIILDADNIMSDGFVDNLVSRLKEGNQIVQGHRTAKNSNTNFAILDGLSEEINNAIFRKGHRTLGLSSALIGSGFGCEFHLFKEQMQQIKAVGGFDKELEICLLRQNIQIAYAENATVYDEKIQHPNDFVNQRRRWLSAQLIYLRKNLYYGCLEWIKNGNIDYFDKVVQFMMPPRIIMLGITYSINLLYVFLLLTGITPVSQSWFFYWLTLAVVSSAALLIALPAKKYDLSILKSLWALPSGFLLTMLALLKTKDANKRFIHTPHGINQKVK